MSGGATLKLFKTSHTQKKKEYTSTACGSCPLKGQCTGAARRVIVRDFYEDEREAMHQRAITDPQWMKRRREIVEHPYGTMKWLMAGPRFLVRGLKKAKAELALGVLSYNLKRVINLLEYPPCCWRSGPPQPESEWPILAITAVPTVD